MYTNLIKYWLILEQSKAKIIFLSRYSAVCLYAELERFLIFKHYDLFTSKY